MTSDTRTESRLRAPRTPALMVQGTCSNAGKSILAAAFCRIFLQDGLRVAPFKAQNMALNSCVTPDGLEMGRAQAVQAAACRLDPDVRMNPVLLKPCSDVGSQVIVMGRPVGVMRVRQYVDYKPQARDAAFAAYDSLAAEHDVMVIEGAGSPAEINLKAHDIVNMAMARHAGARVLLVGDIDRGGVFAALVGTMELLDGWERDHVAGYLLNKFRGDASLLDPALDFMKQRTGRPVLGVVPYLRDLGLPEEDSVTFKEGLPGLRDGTLEDAGPDASGYGLGLVLDIVLVDLPHISNFTDVDALRGEPDVRLRVARTPAELAAPDGRMPDAVILPGSKNTTGDLRTLRATGMADALASLARDPDGPMVAGICAGLQMLGLCVADPLGLEGGGSEQGLGLLPVRTELAAEKTLRRMAGVHPRSGLPVAGYEIRHGVTVAEGSGGDGLDFVDSVDAGGGGCAGADAAFPFLLREDGGPLGWGTHGGRVWGTSLHGVFDADGFRRHFLDGLRMRRGMAPLGRVMAPYSLDPALDRLADAVRAAVDMDAIYDMLNLRPDRM
ncbi:cobyric acid synthase [Nitratidesulfovibrio sp. SRB-5]|uniref:cobyric acid synthase n=1 Tax=Nitratidesulfovibrio sp. SRB-5 TaxID=2872636 RepID=UPI0010284A21|nr:cobyric acid synthase [Nitratidesulfovibrio sp. SRB-5]MBZ2171036.1 cobyric acid synthase [Nitratidesulfovibrio sp. SRB-5]RXF76291.1 cobyric acid synthase [Desulfovibrio sp. DS-1]